MVTGEESRADKEKNPRPLTQCSGGILGERPTRAGEMDGEAEDTSGPPRCGVGQRRARIEPRPSSSLSDERSISRRLTEAFRSLCTCFVEARSTTKQVGTEYGALCPLSANTYEVFVDRYVPIHKFSVVILASRFMSSRRPYPMLRLSVRPWPSLWHRSVLGHGAFGLG